MQYKIKEIGGIFCRETEIETPFDSLVIDDASKVNEFFNNIIVNSPRFTPDVENFIVLFLNTRKRLNGYQIIGMGSLDTVIAHPREVFRAAIVNNSSAIIVCHNHPSGISDPSEADIKVTRDLVRAGQLLKIEVLDHIILGKKTSENKGYHSLREMGYFYS